MDINNLPVDIASRLKCVPEDKRQIAEFIIKYADKYKLNDSEDPEYFVPTFRVLDALSLNGKNYCSCQQ